MSRRLAALRVLLAVAAVSAIAACASPTAPTTSHLRSITPASHDVNPDSGSCRSGYSVSQGYHC